jgi:hypothetical protein
MSYNGWKNWETWNVWLWATNDPFFYNDLRRSGTWKLFVERKLSLGLKATPDGAKWDDPAIDTKRLEEACEEEFN